MAELRKIVGYSAIKDRSNPANLRELLGYAVVVEDGAFPMAKESSELFFDLVASVSNAPMNPSDITFGVPATISSGGRNTKLEVSSTPTAPFTGTVTFEYRRLPISRLFIGKAISSPFNPVDSVGECLNQINQRYNIKLTLDDVEDFVYNQQTWVTLQAKASSLLLQPGTIMIVGKASEMG